MSRTMYDGVSPSRLPRNVPIVAGYIDGRFAWSAADWALFPHAQRVYIAVFASTNGGHVLDVEPGDATPAQAPGWVLKRRAAGVDPTVYCNASTWPSVRAAFKNAGVAEPHYWIAQYDGKAVIPTGAVAKQYASLDPYDVSVVADYWPGVDPEPAPSPFSEGEDMTPAVVCFKDQFYEFAVGPDGVLYVNDPADNKGFLEVGGKWTSGVSAAVDSKGNIVVVGKGTDGAMWQAAQAAGKGTWAITRVGGKLA